MSKRLFWLVTVLVVLTMVIAACGGAATPTQAPAEEPKAEEPKAEEPKAEEPAPDTSGVTELNILWAQWDPADYLQQLVKDYEAETGIKVNIIQEPWGSFGDRFFTEMAAGGDAWDMVVGDSQWLGQGSTQGHYLDLTDFMVSEGMDKSVAPATLTYYGEYPTGSGQYWGFPTEGDADGWAYRKDLFEDPDNMAAFEAEYGYALDVPKTFDELMDIANFFTRPEEGLYGVGIYTQKDYDAMTMGVENMLFSYGADWKDPKTNVVEGVLNSPEGVASLQYYKDLYDCCQAPGLSNAFFAETNDAFISGQAAMIMNYFAFFPALANPGVNPYAETTGYFSNPTGPGGESYAALGGQGTSIISYISPERQQASKDFLKWFAQDDVQARWGALGGYTCNTKALESPEFLELNPFNPAFAETMVKVKDFWNIPEFGQLLEITQREFGGYVVEGVGTAQEAMDNIAAEHTVILEEAGYITEGGEAMAEEKPMAEVMYEDAPGVTELTILWAQWDPADYLTQLVKDYEAETGIKVNIIQEPWGSFGDRFFTEMAAGGDAWDMVVGDSQWLGQGATQGHYMDMTDFMVNEGLADSVAPATLTYYGEYPTGSGQYWGFPTEGDADGWAYRKDLFEDPDNMAAFEEEYGYALDVPKTFDELKDIAEFFTRPEEGLYGVAIYTQKDYDAMTMGVENTLFSWGADWKDPKTNVVEGVLNSPEGVASLQYYKDLYDCCQAPGLSNAFFAEVNDAFISGQAAMAMNYFAFFPALANPGVNPYAETTGYFSNPAGPGGESFAALGGQGTSIISYISPERQAASRNFIRWFAQDDVQARWGALGGYTCNTKALQSPEFLELNPFNPAFAETMVKVKDFWNIPEFGQLLEITQREFSGYIVEGVGTAQETMDTIAVEHTEILQDAGYIE